MKNITEKNMNVPIPLNEKIKIGDKLRKYLAHFDGRTYHDAGWLDVEVTKINRVTFEAKRIAAEPKQEVNGFVKFEAWELRNLKRIAGTKLVEQVILQDI